MSSSKSANTSTAETKQNNYHHGDLHRCLLQAARQLVQQQGIAALSLRRLADQVGVSRTALYHHFKDKNALICALAQQGFDGLAQSFTKACNDTSTPIPQRYSRYARAYIDYARENQELYNLMFGPVLWRTDAPSEELKQVAYSAFQQYLGIVRDWQRQGVFAANQDPLRLAQVTWGTLHGLAQLVIDGVYVEGSAIDEICDCAGELARRG